MKKLFLDYPISGRAVCRVINSMAGPNDQWVVQSIETLTSKDSVRLGDIWRRSQLSKVVISTGDLCSALVDADQVVNLDLHLAFCECVGLLIEDGVVINYSFDK